jgi:hypothetical protein
MPLRFGTAGRMLADDENYGSRPETVRTPATDPSKGRFLASAGFRSLPKPRQHLPEAGNRKSPLAAIWRAG